MSVEFPGSAVVEAAVLAEVVCGGFVQMVAVGGGGVVGRAAVAPDGAFGAVNVGAELGRRSEVLGAGDAVVMDSGQGVVVAEELFSGREVDATRRALVMVWGVEFVSC